jgi:bacterioferritin
LAERVLIDHYHELIGYFSSCDPATSALLQDIAQEVEYHINDMQDLCAISSEQT